MKVRISFTVDVDPLAWSENYGVTGSDVRPDVQNYAEQVLLQQFEESGVLA